MANGLVSLLLGGGTKGRELRETRRAWQECQTLWRASRVGKSELSRLAIDITKQAVAGSERSPALPILIAVAQAVETLLSAESIGDIEPLWDLIETDVEVASGFRQMVARRRRWVASFNGMYCAFERVVRSAIQTFFRALPESAFEDFDDEDRSEFDVVLLDLLDSSETVIECLFMLPYADESFRLDLFNQLRDLCASNMLIASGFRPDTNIRQVERKLVRIKDQRGKTPAELADLYLAGSPLRELVEIPVPFRIPEQVRFEHCHIVGGTGHGKTQLMQKMIHADLLASREDGRSVIVIDSQGDLINKLVRLDLFSPGKPGSLADRLVLIDPADVEYPAALNLFDAHLERAKEYSPADRERVLNGVIELYELFFGSFLGAELTQKQGVVFKYLARLMLAIPDATIHTLMRIMEDGGAFKRYMDKLDGSARYFFETEFFHPSFAATKKQILRRLWGVLSTPAFERMFTQKRNKVDLFDAMNEGKIILVSTAKDLLKRDGSQLLGRFMIAMVTQAALERSTLKEYLRRPCFVYVDEAQEYFDDSIETILNQARKYHVGLTLAHQTLDQLSPRLRSAMLSNTSVKCAGGVSAKDARALADELRTTPAFIEGMRRRGPRSEFAVWVKQHTGQAIRLTVPLGLLEKQPTLDDEEFDELIAVNRERYCGTLSDIELYSPPISPDTVGAPPEKPRADAHAKEPVAEMKPEVPRLMAPEPRAPTATPQAREAEPAKEPRPDHPYVVERELGKGGRQHKYLQSLIKELAEQEGLKATIEAPLSIGSGQVDVLIERGGILAAVEISVSTPVEHERENLRKCLDAGYPRIALVLAKSKKAQSSYRDSLNAVVPEALRERVSYLTPEDIPAFIASLAPPPQKAERVVKGYRVRGTLVQPIAPDAKAREEALSKLIVKSLKR